ncbi:anaerobic sn-glycerol-3-phosphate dehydrogenase C subunit [Escherichia coli]|nr:anaerobic sn-glycerol-3-phosphate dehydrogenase C subunit [Escherichia coli]
MNDTSFHNCIKSTVCPTACPVSRVNQGYPGQKQPGPDGTRSTLHEGLRLG